MMQKIGTGNSSKFTSRRSGRTEKPKLLQEGLQINVRT